MSTEIASTEASGRRLDIQGLRGLAIVPGFTFHMTGHLPGAVIFIDMFFAMSGYLITGRLIHLAQARSRRGYFIEFYKFRAKRLFPASIATLAMTTVLAYVLFVPSRAGNIFVDVVAALFFYANIHFAVQGTDYMHHGQTTSPVLPFWSLSMEEQFYLVWPVIVVTVIVWSVTRSRQREVLTWVFGTVLVASFGYGYWFTATHQVAAYYDTLSRTWDFAVGALLAVYAMRGRLAHGPTTPLRDRLLKPVRSVRDLLNRHASVVSWTGGLIFIGAIFVTPTDKGFPVPWGALGVLGAALVIFAGIDQRASNRLLDNRFSAWLGDISYSIYLVHFPVMIFALSYLSANTMTLYGFDIVATLGLSLLVFYFIEEPGRRGFAATREWIRAGEHRRVVQAILVCTTAAAVLWAATPTGPAAWTYQGAAGTACGQSQDANPAAPALPVGREFDDPFMVAPLPALTEDLRSSLALTEWPRLTNEDRIEEARDFLIPCDAVDLSEPPCIARPAGGTDPAKVAVALGDSTMLSYWPMLRDSLVPQGWTVVLAARTSCTAVQAQSSDAFGDCSDYHAAFPALLETWQPALTFITTGERIFADLGKTAAVESEQLPRASRVYAEGLTTTIELAQAEGSQPVLLSPAPAVETEQMPGSCVVRGSTPQRCAYTPGEAWYAQNASDRQLARSTGATYADLVSFFCVDQVCPGSIGDVVVHADKDHITPESAELMAPSFEAWLQSSGVTR